METPQTLASVPQVTKSVTPPSNKLTAPVTDAQTVEFFGLLEDGLNVSEAARQVGILPRTGYRILERYEARVDGVSKLLSAKAFEAAEHWMSASAVASAKGDHRPAKDWLLSVKAVEPIGDSATSTRIAIIIGTPEHPLQVNRPEVIDVSVEKSST